MQGSNPGVDARHMSVEFVVGSLPCAERFSSGYSGLPSPQKPTFPYLNSTRNQVDEEPLCGRTAPKKETTKRNEKKNALYLSVNVFSTKVLIRDGTAILRGHPSRAKV